MVIGDKLPWRLVLKLHAGWLAAVFVVAFGARVWIYFGGRIPFTPVPFQIAGVAIAIFLAFRNNSSYDRWWEGRKLWGAITNSSRTFARQVMTFIDGSTEAGQTVQRELVHRHVAWLNALRHQLRGEPALEGSDGLISKDEQGTLSAQKNVAAWLVHQNGLCLADAVKRGLLTEQRHMWLDATLTELINHQGGCERLKTTPIPTAYRFFTHRFTRLFIVVLPLGLVEQLGPFTIGTVCALAFIFLVLDTIGQVLEDPFSLGPNGLALSAMCRNIEINLRQQLGETELPPALVPEHRGVVDVLM
ncbi:MAG: bestrophin family protein [Myxococcaceae bacterium]|nr:bestrophin family protein [Myxococcaceae bacterium]